MVNEPRIDLGGIILFLLSAPPRFPASLRGPIDAPGSIPTSNTTPLDSYLELVGSS